MKTKAEVVAQIKAEILEDIAAGRVPADVKSFGDLHDYRDANCYGGFCDDAVADEMIAHFGGRPEHEGMPDAMIEFINEVQEEIHTWLAAGRPEDGSLFS